MMCLCLYIKSLIIQLKNHAAVFPDSLLSQIVQNVKDSENFVICAHDRDGSKLLIWKIQ